jgi:hypothetical protein
VNDRVALPDEHERAVARGLGGELAGESALARAGFSAQQHNAPAFALGSRQQRPQHAQLGGPTDERKRRRDPESARSVLHDSAPVPDDSQI